jgi:hypothetical protein
MINKEDKRILRGLAKQVGEIADLPIMQKRREMWIRHNRLERVCPMIIISPEGSWRELLPESTLTCTDEKARKIEWELRRRIYQHRNINDDQPIEKVWKVDKIISGIGTPGSIDLGIDWGLNIKRHSNSKENGSFGFEPVLNDFADIKKLKVPEISYDEASTINSYEEISDIFGDLLDVKLVGICGVLFHFMYYYTGLRGLEQMMYDLYDEPNFVHEVLCFFEQGYNDIIKQCIAQNLFSLNNDDTIHGSGGLSYSSELPKPDFNPDRIRPCDMLAGAESQEMSSISPEQHEEFAMQYERRILSQFGLNAYGCCDPLTHKLDNVFKIPNLRRISVSPWADVDICAEKIKNKYIYSWKPNPVYLSGKDFDPQKIREYIRHTLDVTKDCVIEMILADTHTCQNQPERFTNWVKIERELLEQS